MGYGVTLQTGYKYALKYGFDHVLQMDGDGQHDPRYLPLLLREVREGEADVVIGSRFLGEGDYRAARLRQMGICLFRFASRLWPEDHLTPPPGPSLEPPGGGILRPGFFSGIIPMRMCW
jgi:glycosyltransferase involved in cell wall biosynthesis